jgi:protein-S-isoprenylcysteine O-methyltransferase Ste14
MLRPFPTSPLQLAFALLWLLLFIAAVIEKRLRTSGSPLPASRRSQLSIAGVLLQTAGFFIIGIGRIDATADVAAPASLALSMIVLCAGAGAVLLFRSSAKVLGDNWSIVARTRAEHSLITDGPFRRVRHPIYLSMLLLLVAIGVGFGHLVALTLGVPLFLIGTAIRMREEERLLVGQFGDAYRLYARETPALIPRLL